MPCVFAERSSFAGRLPFSAPRWNANLVAGEPLQSSPFRVVGASVPPEDQVNDEKFERTSHCPKAVKGFKGLSLKLNPHFGPSKVP